MKNLIFITLLFLKSLTSYTQSVSIKNDGPLPDASSMLDIKSTTKGMLLHRITTAQRTATCAFLPMACPQFLLARGTNNVGIGINFPTYNFRKRLLLITILKI